RAAIERSRFRGRGDCGRRRSGRPSGRKRLHFGRRSPLIDRVPAGAGVPWPVCARSLSMAILSFNPLARRRSLRWLLAAALVLVIGLGLYAIAWGLWADDHWRAAGRALDRDDLHEARAHLQLCLEVHPRSPDVHFLLARTERRLGSFEDAERHLVACARHGGDADAIDLERFLRRAQSGD